MPSWCFAAVVLVMATDPDPSVLVSKLGSKNGGERESAAVALQALGTKALPALRAARDGQDVEIRQRAALLIQKIEGAQLVRPSLVALDFSDRPMSDVIQSISAATGCRLSIYEVRKDWLATRITLHKPGPVSFWKTVDSLCEAGRFQYNLGMGPDGTSVALFRDEISGPASDHGAFRVLVDEIVFNHRYRKVHLPGGGLDPPEKKDEDKSFITLWIMVEPRMMIRSGGRLERLSAVDDRGQTLLPDDLESQQPHHDFGFTPAAFVIAHVPLKNLKQPGRTVKKLRGVAPVVVAALKAESLVIPLDRPAGRPYKSGESVLTIQTIRNITPAAEIIIEPVNPDGEPQKLDRPAQATEIELTLRRADGLDSPRVGFDLSEEQFEVVDAQGRVWTPSPWWLSGSGPKQQGVEVRVRLNPVDGNLVPWRGDLAGAKLRYFEMTVAKVDVPFEFSDLALP
jgi:hypothetical protein